MIKDPYLVLFLWFFIIFIYLCIVAWIIEMRQDKFGEGDNDEDKS